MQQPPAERNAVGLVVEFLRVQLVKCFQLSIFKDLGVQIGHPVHAKAIVDIHMGHMHQVRRINYRHGRVFKPAADPAVQNFYDGDQLGHYLFQIGNGPFFQGFCQNCMVCVGTGLFYDLHRFIKINPPLREQPDQLRDHHGRMGIVDLDYRIIRQVMEGTPFFHALIQNHLGPVADHKILLVNPQFPPCLITVVRVQKQGQVFGDVFFVKGNPFFHNPFVYCFHVKQMQPIGPVMVSGYRNIVKPGVYGQLPKPDRVRNFPADQPALAFHPGIGDFFLQPVFKLLLKQAQMVIQPDPGAV